MKFFNHHIILSITLNFFFDVLPLSIQQKRNSHELLFPIINDMKYKENSELFVLRSANLSVDNSDSCDVHNISH